MPRTQLIDLFDNYPSARVMLVEAPAGYSRSMAVAGLAFIWNLIRAI